MAWLTTDNDRQVRFKDQEMESAIEWSENRKAQTDADTAEYLVETYEDISYADDTPDSDEFGDEDVDSEMMETVDVDVEDEAEVDAEDIEVDVTVDEPEGDEE